ncbi:collagen-like protein [uncultured Friedmanniella sp.]|uniref:collagen-like triple helix repeat-containing protein n=1 Tax=uncultured Friedmanniella sp. TaxID=335381 RepID=UPI0035CC2DBB
MGVTNSTNQVDRHAAQHNTSEAVEAAHEARLDAVEKRVTKVETSKAGPKGEKGADGKDGAAGSVGPAGTAGTDGIDGRNGVVAHIKNASDADVTAPTVKFGAGLTAVNDGDTVTVTSAGGGGDMHLDVRKAPTSYTKGAVRIVGSKTYIALKDTNQQPGASSTQGGDDDTYGEDMPTVAEWKALPGGSDTSAVHYNTTSPWKKNDLDLVGSKLWLCLKDTPFAPSAIRDTEWTLLADGAAGGGSGGLTVSDHKPAAGDGSDGDVWLLKSAPMAFYVKDSGVWRGGYTQQPPAASGTNIGLGTTRAVGTSNYPVDLAASSPSLWNAARFSGARTGYNHLESLRFPFRGCPVGALACVDGRASTDSGDAGTGTLLMVTPGSTEGVIVGNNYRMSDWAVGKGSALLFGGYSLIRVHDDGTAVSAAFGSTGLNGIYGAVADSGRCWVLNYSPLNTADSGYSWQQVCYQNADVVGPSWTANNFGLHTIAGVDNTKSSATLQVLGMFSGGGWVWAAVYQTSSSSYVWCVKPDDTTTNFTLVGTAPGFNHSQMGITPDGELCWIVSAAGAADGGKPSCWGVTMIRANPSTREMTSVTGLVPASFDDGGFPQTLNGGQIVFAPLGNNKFAFGGVVWSSQLDKTITTVGTDRDCRRPVIYVADLNGAHPTSTMVFDGAGYTAPEVRNNAFVSFKAGPYDYYLTQQVLNTQCDIFGITRTPSGFAAYIRNGNAAPDASQTDPQPSLTVALRATAIGVTL